MRAFGDRVPRWPVLAGVLALAGAALIAAFVPPILSSAAIVLLVVRLAALTRPVKAAQLGLRAPDDLPRALLLAGGAALALAAVAAAWQALGDPREALTVPPELDTRTVVAQAYDLPLREPVAFGPGLLASALVRCVLPVVAGEILVRGFAFPALSQWRGPVVSAVVVSVLFGGFAGTPGLAALSMLLGVALCFLYLATGSLLPGIALAAAASATSLGAACALPAAQTALLAVLCAGAAILLAARPRVAARRLPALRAA